MPTYNNAQNSRTEQIGFSIHRTETDSQQAPEQVTQDIAHIALTQFYEAYGEERDGALVIAASE